MNLPLKVNKFFLVFFNFLFLFYFCLKTEAAVTLHYPEKHHIGQPFIALVSSDTYFDNASIVWFEREIPIEVVKYEDGYRAYALLGADANKVKDGSYALEFRFLNDDGKQFAKSFDIGLTMPKYRENRLTVAPKMVNPPQSAMKRIESEAKLTAKARMHMSPQKMWQLKAIKPIDKPLFATSSYGFRRVYNGIPRGRHSGVDLRAPTGTPIRTIFSGKVILTGDHYFAGKSVYIDSGNGVVSAYFHLSAIKVKTGDIITAGDIIGAAGATGRVTGPHLHLSVLLAGHSIDPLRLLDTGFPNIVGELKVVKL